MTKSTGGPAFPLGCFIHPNGEIVPMSAWVAEGLTIRDWFAGMALTGICANSALDHSKDPAVYGRVAYGLADAMIVQRDALKGDV